MKKLITIAVDAMGGDNAPQKIIDGIELHHKKSKNVFYKLFGDKNIIDAAIKAKSIDKNIIEIIHTQEKIKGGIAITNPNYKFTGNAVSTSFDVAQADRTDTSGYKTSKTGGSLGTSFEQYENIIFSPSKIIKLGPKNSEAESLLNQLENI